MHPEFYKVGVSVNAAVDDRLFPLASCPLPGLPQYEDFAKNLCGKLLLIHGMLDEVISVSATLQLVEALKKANKSFDMLLLPSLGHGSDGYCIRRGWDYLVEHLQGETPPENFEVHL